jgi:hypothetical protein
VLSETIAVKRNTLVGMLSMSGENDSCSYNQEHSVNTFFNFINNDIEQTSNSLHFINEIR